MGHCGGWGRCGGRQFAEFDFLSGGLAGRVGDSGGSKLVRQVSVCLFVCVFICLCLILIGTLQSVPISFRQTIG